MFLYRSKKYTGVFSTANIDKGSLTITVSMEREGREHGEKRMAIRAFFFTYFLKFIINLNRQKKRSFSFFFSLSLDKSLDKMAMFYFQFVILFIDMKKVFK
jgi:hypothetical protein